MLKTTTITISSAAQEGRPLRSSQNIGGPQIKAKNAASKNGTKIASAAFMPATTITKAAIISKIPGPDRWPIESGSMG